MNNTFRLGVILTIFGVFDPCLALFAQENPEKNLSKKGLNHTTVSSWAPPLDNNFFHFSPSSKFFVNFTPQTKARVSSPSTEVTTGMASWYGPGFEGRLSANGEVFNPNDLTAAHRTLPFNTRVRVTNLSNNRSVIVRINDRGPYSNNRLIDLSAQAAREIGMYHVGVAQVRLEILR